MRCVAGTKIPDIQRKELFEEISKLGEDINKIKLEQINKINEIRNDVKENTTKQILQSSGCVFSLWHWVSSL